MAATTVNFRNEQSGEVKSVKVGWSWTLFLFAGFFGVPLFMRKVWLYAALMCGLVLLNIIVQNDLELRLSFGKIITYIGIGLSFMWGWDGNKLTAKYYLKNGWEWDGPDDQSVETAKAKWAVD